jgi:hypothetical protein
MTWRWAATAWREIRASGAGHGFQEARNAGVRPRGLQGQGLNYATAPIGAPTAGRRHGLPEMVGIPTVDPHEWKRKANW